MTVRVEKNDAVTTVILDRPHARNAVDGPTAMDLHAAFDEFDKDDSASVAVLRIFVPYHAAPTSFSRMFLHTHAPLQPGKTSSPNTGRPGGTRPHEVALRFQIITGLCEKRR